MASDLLAIAQQQGQQFLEPDEHVLAVFQAQARGFSSRRRWRSG